MEPLNRSSQAKLSVSGEFTCFSFNGLNVRFRTSAKLRKFLRVKEWDHGYIVVDAVYDGFDAPVEDYIDLIPILKNLYIDPATFLAPIKEVVPA